MDIQMDNTFDFRELVFPIYEHQSEFAEDDIKSTTKRFAIWLAQTYMYTHGYLNGLWKQQDGHGSFVVRNRIEDSKINFYSGYGLLKMQILNKTSESSTNDAWSEFEMFNRRDLDFLSLDQILRCSNTIQQLSLAIIPNSTLSKKICLCESGACDNLRFFAGRSDGGLKVLNYEHLICELHGGRYMCNDCIEHLTLEAPLLALEAPKTSKKHAQVERDKMSVSIRFAVMERDNFACKACGRTYRKDGVKLHVDHIHPVSKGGKTEMSNLQTLCQDCNLGKSAKIVADMELWNV